MKQGTQIVLMHALLKKLHLNRYCLKKTGAVLRPTKAFAPMMKFNTRMCLTDLESDVSSSSADKLKASVLFWVLMVENNVKQIVD